MKIIEKSLTAKLAQKTLRQLSPKNPLDQFRLLWWILVTPQQLIDYRELYGDEDEERVGQWLVSTLAWWPLLVPTLALGLGQLPPPDKAWLLEVYQWLLQVLPDTFEGWLPDTVRLADFMSAWLPEIYLLFSALLLLCWLLTGRLGHKRKEILMVKIAVGLAILVAVGVGLSVAVVVAVVMAISVALGVMVTVQSEVTGDGLASIVARGVEMGVVYDVVLALANSVATILAGVGLTIVFMFLVAGGVRVSIEKNLETGMASTTTRLILVYLVFVNVLLILLCFLGGWWVWRV